MENMKEIITKDTKNNKEYKMRQFSDLCKYDLLLCCSKCSKILCSSTLIEKLLRLNTGKICFIMEEENEENSELIEDFTNNLTIKKLIYINQKNPDFKTVGVSEVLCKKCEYVLGVKMKTTDDIQIFMLNKILLKNDAIKVLSFGDFGLKNFNFYFKKETIRSMDKEAYDLDEYIQKSGNYIQSFFEILSAQCKIKQDLERRKDEIDKLGEVLRYLVDKNYV